MTCTWLRIFIYYWIHLPCDFSRINGQTTEYYFLSRCLPRVHLPITDCAGIAKIRTCLLRGHSTCYSVFYLLIRGTSGTMSQSMSSSYGRYLLTEEWLRYMVRDWTFWKNYSENGSSQLQASWSVLNICFSNSNKICPLYGASALMQYILRVVCRNRKTIFLVPYTNARYAWKSWRTHNVFGTNAQVPSPCLDH